MDNSVEEHEEVQKDGFPKHSRIGYGLVAGIIVAGIALSILFGNCSFMTEEEMAKVQEGLTAEFPAEDIEVLWNSTMVNGKLINTLAIVLANPTFAISSNDSTKHVARRIAEVATASYPKIVNYDQVVVKFVAQGPDSGTFNTFKELEFGFPVRDVLPTGDPLLDISDVFGQGAAE